MLTYTLKKTPGHPLYEQLYQSIRDDIAAGRLPAGSRLPSKRVLAAHLGVSVVTVESAYAQLLAEGYAEARPRSGVYVCAIGSSVPVQPPHMPSLPQPPAPEPLFDLSGGTGEDVPFPASVWVRTMREVIADKRLMQPVDFAGAPELRAAIAAHLEQARGLRVSPEQIFIGAGTEYLYGLIVQLLGRRLRYAVEDPGYRKISGIYAANDVTVCPIGLDSEGLSVEALRASGAQIAHISPAHHYPTGIVMPIRRRNALLAWAAEAPERYIIEDDYDSEFRFDTRPLPSLQGMAGADGPVVYLSTCSRSLAPGIRIAYMVLPRQLLGAWQAKYRLYSGTVGRFEQQTLARFITGGYFTRHLARERTAYKARRDALVAALRTSFAPEELTLAGLHTGLHLLAQLKDPPPDAALRAAARQYGVRCSLLSDYDLTGTAHSAAGTLVLGYGSLPDADCAAAGERLKKLCTAAREASDTV